MNAKKVKRIRQMLRRHGIAVGHVEYSEGPKGRRAVNTGQLNRHGMPTDSVFNITGTVRLAPSCGRRVYQEFKKTVA